MDTFDLHSLATRQRAQAVFWTQRDVWLTAAFMTLFLGPLGALFGLAALLAMRGLSKAIRDEQTHWVAQRLRHGRRLVLFGLGFSILLDTVMLVRFYLTYSDLAAQFQLSAQESSDAK